MSQGLHITIYDESGQKQIINDLRTKSGTIVTKEMEKGAPKVITTISDIKASNYEIIDIGLPQFDDSKTLEDKISECRSRIEFYENKLSIANNYIPKNNVKINDIKNQIKIYQDELAYGIASGSMSQDEQDDIKYDIEELKDKLDSTEKNIQQYTSYTKTHPILIDKYNKFLNDLVTYGNQKTVQKIESIGKQDDDDEVDLENLDINQAPGMALSRDVVNAVSQYLEATVQSLIASGAAGIMGKIGVNEDNLQLAHQILNLMDSSIFKIQSILKFVPSNIHMVPSAKIAMSSICTSLKDMFDAIYMSVEQKYYETINDAITNLPSAQEALKDAQELLINLATNMIDEQCVKYTGFHLVELYYKCSGLIAKYKQWQRQKKETQQLREQGYIDAGSSIEFDHEAIKSQLMEELSKASDLIYNAFMILQIRDAIMSIKELIRQFNNIDLTVLADGINSLDDLMMLLDEIGLNDDSAILSLKDSIEFGINNFQNQFNGLMNQLAIQGVASGITMANTIKNSSKTQFNIGTTQAFSFSNNLDNFELILNIYENPTIKKVRKNIISALTHATNNQGDNIFHANDILTIAQLLDKGNTERKDQKIDIANITFIIHFELDGYNLPESMPYDTYEAMQKQIKEEEEKQRKDQEDAIHTFELGVITEEYTKDPTEAAKRPTIALVHELYAILSEIFPLMKIFAELVSNYKINKAKVENNAQGNIFGMIKVLAKLNNLFKKCNTKNKNFFTIRSLQLYHYVTEHIKQTKDDSPELQLSLEETRTLQLYLKASSLNYEAINIKFETILYIDYDSINEQKNEMQKALDKANGYFGDDASLFVKYPNSKYEDGTTLGLDKVEIAGDEVFYSDSSLPIYGSQIMKCYSRDYDVSI